MKAFALPAALALFLAHPAAARSVLLDFDEYENLWDYTEDDSYCLTEGNIRHCEENYDLYDHRAPHKLLSDYDFFRQTAYVAAPGYRFDPLSFDILVANNSAMRANCAGTTPTASGSRCEETWDWYYEPTDWFTENAALYEPVIYDFLEVRGYREGNLVALATARPESMSEYLFPYDFIDLDRLEVKVLGLYDLFPMQENASWYGPDGYSYTCFDRYFYEPICNYEFTYDNFALNVYPAGQPPLAAAVPLPPAAALMLGGLAMLPLAKRRRKAEA